MAAVSFLHAKSTHPDFGWPHAADKVALGVRDGEVDVAGLAEPGRYAKARWGFWAPYTGSEAVLGLVDSVRGGMAPGPKADIDAVREGLGGVLELASRDTLTTEDLRDHHDLCLCGAVSGADGRMLINVMLPATPEPGSRASHRAQTIRMLLRLYALGDAARAEQAWRILAFDPVAAEDPVLASLEVTPAWTGVALRNQTVAAWRDLWAWMVDQIDGLTPIATLADRLAARLPDVSVRRFLSNLPDTVDTAGRLRRAETLLDDRDLPERLLARLAIGAIRSRPGELDEHVAPYFESPDEDGQQLTPSWLRDRLTVWQDRSLPDFGRSLAVALIERSQRVALGKARMRSDGVFRIPTRVSVRDGGFVFRTSTEGGGPVGLRWDQMSSVLAELGLLRREGAAWRVTDRGAAI